MAARPSQAPKLPSFGVGAWSWGDRLFWGYDEKQDKDIRSGFEYVVRNGVKLVDTAELYGFGRSEELLGQFIRDTKADLTVATKYGPLPWKAGRADVVAACKGSLARLGSESIGLYQIHFPFAWGNEGMWDGLADCYDQGLVKAVGVSNYGTDGLRAVSKALSRRGVPLTSNQIQYSLLYRYPELNGMKEACDELGVQILAYSPICLGALAGKWSMDNLPNGPRLAVAQRLLNDPAYVDLLKLMRGIGAEKGSGVTPSQVAIAWCMAKGTTPIPGIRNLKQAADNLGATSFSLSAREVADLDAAAALVKAAPTPDINPMPRESLDTKQRLFEA